jgi:hypothetical protein
MAFKTLIRFANANGEIRYGDMGDVPITGDLKDVEVAVLDGDLDSGFKKSGKTEKIHMVETLFPPCERRFN